MMLPILLLALPLSSLALHSQSRNSLGSWSPDLPSSHKVHHILNLSNGQSKRADLPAWVKLLSEITASIVPSTSTSFGDQEGIRYQIRSDSYTDPLTGVRHVYLQQYARELPIDGAVGQAHYKDGELLSYSSSFFNGKMPASLVPDQTQQGDHCASVSPLSTQQLIGQSHHAAHPCHSHSSHSHKARNYIPKSSSGIVSAQDAALSFVALASEESMRAQIWNSFTTLAANIEVSSVTSFDSGMTPTVMLSNVPGTHDEVKAHLAYIQVPIKDANDVDDIGLALVWRMEVDMGSSMYETTVSATDPGVPLSITDWVNDAPIAISGLPTISKFGQIKDFLAEFIKSKPSTPHQKKPYIHLSKPSYRVYPLGVNDPSESGRQLLTDLHDIVASPLGWHSIPARSSPFKTMWSDSQYVNFTDTRGNNVFAQENWEGANEYVNNYRPDAGPERVFNYHSGIKHTDGKDLEPHSYVNASVTQLFVTCNELHDFYYRYGFTEAAGNFQQDNFGHGGSGNDAVIANAQDGSGYNNANFMTPPDGRHPRMRMYIWNLGHPFKDGDFAAGIVQHEYSHGLSIRLTGGPQDSSCLGWGESGGMGEGWGDALATLMRRHENYQDYPVGSWVYENPLGLRRFPYSTNMTTNPHLYSVLDKPSYFEVHASGEVWAEFLFEVSEALIEKHGFSKVIFPPSAEDDQLSDFYLPSEVDSKGKPRLRVPKHGNTLMVRLLIDGMKLQPCRPTFIQARDAILQADEILTQGANSCIIWKAFAKRGLGIDSSLIGNTPWGGGFHNDGFKVPSSC